MPRHARVLRSHNSALAFSPADYTRLERMLSSRPGTVLAAFGMAQVSCLFEVDAYHRIKADRPDLASRIVAIAALMFIPETLDVDAVLTDRPGEV